MKSNAPQKWHHVQSHWRSRGVQRMLQIWVKKPTHKLLLQCFSGLEKFCTGDLFLQTLHAMKKTSTRGMECHCVTVPPALSHIGRLPVPVSTHACYQEFHLRKDRQIIPQLNITKKPFRCNIWNAKFDLACY